MTVVTAIGECMLELTHQSDSAMNLGYAGDTYNTAVYLRRLTPQSVDVGYVTATGDDWYSEQMIARMVAEGLTPCAARMRDATPGLYLIRVDTAGERSFSYHRAGSPPTRMFDTRWSAPLINRIRNTDLVYLSAITLQILSPEGRETLWATLRQVRERGGIIAFDSNYRPKGWASPEAAREAVRRTLPLVDIALPSLDDERALFGDAGIGGVVNRYRTSGASQIVVKDGHRGTTLCVDDGHLTLVPPVSVRQPVDTTAAGDSFNAGYLAGTLSGATPFQSVQLAQMLAAEVVMHPGALIPRTQFEPARFLPGFSAPPHPVDRPHPVIHPPTTECP